MTKPLTYLTLALVLVFLVQATAPRRTPEPPSTAPALFGAPRTLEATPSLAGAIAGSIPVSNGGAPQTVITGTSTWYCGHGSACTRGYGPSDMVAAIDPTLGIPKGTLLTVRHDGRAILVRAVDVCACSGRRIIDLTSGAFSRLANLSQGVITVEIARATAPATYTEGNP